MGGAEVLADYSATLNWGDGSTSTGMITVSGSVFTVILPHKLSQLPVTRRHLQADDTIIG